MPMNALFTLIYILAAVVSAAASGVVWRRQGVWGARALALMLTATALWAAFDAIELQATTPEGKRFVSRFQYLAIVAVAPLYFHVAFELAGLRARLTRPVLIAVWSVPLLTLLVAWTSQWHAWLWRDVTIPDASTNLGVYHYGPWFWVLVAHNYLLFAIATVVLIVAARRIARPFRVAIAIVVAAVMLPWLGNVAYVFKMGPLPGLNWFTISVIAAGSVLGWVVKEQGLLEILPHARDVLIESMIDGVVVLDRANRILFANGPARDLLYADLEAGPAPPSVLELLNESRGTHERAIGDESDPRAWLEVRVTPVRDRWDHIAARLITIRDITHRRKLQAERERLIRELTEALGRVRTLEGLLLICANCKRVRDDRGSWSRLDAYVRDRTRVEFSHGLCPDCLAQLYPEESG